MTEDYYLEKSVMWADDTTPEERQRVLDFIKAKRRRDQSPEERTLSLIFARALARSGFSPRK
jgi:hypothetical protein